MPRISAEEATVLRTITAGVLDIVGKDYLCAIAYFNPKTGDLMATATNGTHEAMSAMFALAVMNQGGVPIPVTDPKGRA